MYIYNLLFDLICPWPQVQQLNMFEKRQVKDKDESKTNNVKQASYG